MSRIASEIRKNETWTQAELNVFHRLIGFTPPKFDPLYDLDEDDFLIGEWMPFYKDCWEDEHKNECNHYFWDLYLTSFNVAMIGELNLITTWTWFSEHMDYDKHLHIPLFDYSEFVS